MFKYKLCVLFLFVLILCGFSFVNADGDNFPLLGKVIYIDPGHGRYYYAKVVETEII